MDAVQVLGMVVAGLVAGLGVGLYAGALLVQANWQRETIKRGLALYDPITGKWRWREPTDTPDGGEGRE